MMWEKHEGYFEFKEKDSDKRRRVEIVDFVESINLIELVIRGNFRGYYEEIPMIFRINANKFLWSLKRDEDGNNIYEQFPYRVTDLMYQTRWQYIED